MLQQLRGRELAAAAEVDVLGNVAHDVDDLLLLVELQALLREVAEANGVADNDATLVDRHLTKQHLDEGRLARAVVAHDAHLLEAREVVVEVPGNDGVAIALRYVLALEDLGADVDVAGLQPNLAFLNALLGHALQLVEGILAVLGLVAAGLRHAPHPLQLRAVEVVGAGYLGTAVVYALLPLLQIVGVVAAIGIDGLVVEFEDNGADTVEEEAVVGHHEQRAVSARQVALQPLYHLQVQVVGRLVEYQQVGLSQQHVGQCHALLLSARKFAHALAEVAYFQLRQHLFGLQHLLLLTLMVEAGIEHRLLRVEHGRLLQHAHPQVATVDDVARVVALLAGEYRQQRRLARAVLGYQPHLLAFAYGEADVAKQRQRAERLRQVLYVKIGGHFDSSRLMVSI